MAKIKTKNPELYENKKQKARNIHKLIREGFFNKPVISDDCDEVIEKHKTLLLGLD